MADEAKTTTTANPTKVVETKTAPSPAPVETVKAAPTTNPAPVATTKPAYEATPVKPSSVAPAITNRSAAIDAQNPGFVKKVETQPGANTSTNTPGSFDHASAVKGANIGAPGANRTVIGVYDSATEQGDPAWPASEHMTIAEEQRLRSQSYIDNNQRFHQQRRQAAADSVAATEGWKPLTNRDGDPVVERTASNPFPDREGPENGDRTKPASLDKANPETDPKVPSTSDHTNGKTSAGT